MKKFLLFKTAARLLEGTEKLMDKNWKSSQQVLLSDVIYTSKVKLTVSLRKV